jgi:hypothetical protein
MKPIETVFVGRVYEHYKGHRYKVLGLAKHSETLEELVVYQALYEPHDIWVRPVAMFLDRVTVNGQVQDRFRPISL